jgi:hypothetical protein
MVKVKLSHRGLDRTLRHQEVDSPRICGQPAHEGVKIVSTTHRPPARKNISGTHFCQRVSDHRAIDCMLHTDFSKAFFDIKMVRGFTLYT